jgi:hypothetical protein
MSNITDSTSSLQTSSSTISMGIPNDEAIYDTSLVDSDHKVHYHNVKDLDHAYELSGNYVSYDNFIC